jgi:CheY-like chemotaxis protein
MYRIAMVVDDSEIERYLSKIVIKKYHFAEQVLVFNSAVGALAYLHSLDQDDLSVFPDVIFLDIHMPVMTGFDFMDKFLEFSGPIKSYSRIIIFSSTDAYEDHVRMRNYPIIHKFIRKPLNEEKLNELTRILR